MVIEKRREVEGIEHGIEVIGRDVDGLRVVEELEERMWIHKVVYTIIKVGNHTKYLNFSVFYKKNKHLNCF